jgi:hypothetical protein
MSYSKLLTAMFLSGEYQALAITRRKNDENSNNQDTCFNNLFGRFWILPG